MFIDQYFEKMINFLLLEIFVSILKVKKNVVGVGIFGDRKLIVFLKCWLININGDFLL